MQASKVIRAWIHIRREVFLVEHILLKNNLSISNSLKLQLDVVSAEGAWIHERHLLWMHIDLTSKLCT